MWLPAVGAVLLGLTVTGAFSWQVESEEQEAKAVLLEKRGDDLADAVTDAVDSAIERLIAVGSFHQGSEEVTQDEFRTFIANFDDIPGMGGIGFMPVIGRAGLAAFEAHMRETIPDYFVWEVDGEGNRVPVAPRNNYVAVQWFEPAEAFGRPHGFDSLSEPNRRGALTRARLTREPTATPLLQLLSRTDDDGFLLYWPVVDDQSSETVGFSIAPMDLGDLVTGQVDAGLIAELDWEIESILPGREPEPAAEGSWNRVMEVGGNTWLLTVSPSEAGSMVSGSDTASVLAIGTVGSIFVGLAVYFYRRKIEAQREIGQLRDLAQAKDQFLASVSHELRTPLTSVLGFTQLLRDSNGDLSEEERALMITSVASEAADLASIIDDLLVSARTELNSLALTKVPVSLRAQVAQVLETVDGTPGQMFEFVGDGAGLVAEGDPGRVRQIVRNLVTNTSRYGGDSVQIRFGPGGDEFVYLEVADDGQGVREGEWEDIFEPYYRAHDSASQPAAIGIGLSVARHLARLMGGDLTYRREEGWSVFRLTLPPFPPNDDSTDQALGAATLTG
ncbi:MAG TPA: CHASE domain-containing protein [Acidimicrobiia bacterium]|nr:CHASE domain-containing protein [Acidimicrobiia bacterium]